MKFNQIKSDKLNVIYIYAFVTNLLFRLLDVEWLKSIWRPDSYFKNAKQVTFQTMTIPNHYVWLYKSRTILYVVKYVLITTFFS